MWEKFLPKGCLFIFCVFYLNEQQVCLIKYVKNQISDFTSHKKKKKKKERKKERNKREKEKRERGAKT